MTAKEWLEKTLPAPVEGYSRMYRHNRPRAMCADGWSVSIQGNTDGHYCRPRDTHYDGVPWEVELGYPSEAEELLLNYAEDKERLTDTVYAYVPIDVLEDVVAKHGGIIGEDIR
jgi:hypothetical protein